MARGDGPDSRHRSVQVWEVSCETRGRWIDKTRTAGNGSRRSTMTKRVTLLAVLVIAAAAAMAAIVELNRGGSKHPQKVIAIATLMSHPALDEVQTGLKQELIKRGYEEGKNVRFVERNANGQEQLTASIAADL